MDRTTIRAVDDAHNLGLDRDAAAMLMIESDSARDRRDPGPESAARACDSVGASATIIAADAQRPTGCARAADGLPRDGAARCRPDGGCRRAQGRVPELLAAIEKVASDQS
jgi:hypothetical protein